MRIGHVAETLVKLHRTRNTILMESAPGVGKSSLIEDEGGVSAKLSEVYDEPFGVITIMGATLEQPDVGGFLYPAVDKRNPDGQRVSAHSIPPVIPHWTHFQNLGGSYHVFEDGEKVEGSFDDVPRFGFLFLDEWGQSAHDVQKAFAEVMLNKRIRGFPLPDGWTVVCATNRMQDRSGVNKSLAFIDNRITRLSVENNLDDWKYGYAIPRGVHPVARAFAEWKPSTVFNGEVPREPGPFCTPRSLVYTTANLLALSSDGMTLPTSDDVAVELARGGMGDGAGTEYIAFIRMAGQLPTFEEIVADPKKCQLPDNERPDALLAVCAMLAARVGEDNAKHAKAVFEYITRLPDEFQIGVVKDIFRTTHAIVEHEAYAHWMKKNQSLLNAALT